MDFIYICREGNNEELRYSIRSVIKNYPNLRKVWVIGGKPKWYTGDFIAVPDSRNKYDNIKNCIKVACETEDISEDFVLMNDDFFILRKLNEVSVYHGGLLINKAEGHQAIAGPNQYATLLKNTDAFLRNNRIVEPLNYDLHVPMVINKTKMRELVDMPYSIRSVYGNIHNIGGTKINDVKVYSHPLFERHSYEMTEESPFISTEDGAFAKMSSSFEKMFPEASKYEHPIQDSNLD